MLMAPLALWLYNPAFITNNDKYIYIKDFLNLIIA